MSDYGLKISKPFFDVNSAADTDLIFSSSWPSLPIIQEVTLSAGETSYTHNIGFPALCSVWQKGSTDFNAFPDQWSRGGLSSFNDTVVNFFAADITHIKFYNIDISIGKEYADLTGDSRPASYDPDYGIKIVKEGESMDSTDLRDYVLHSRAQSPLIKSVVRAETTGTGAFGAIGSAVYTESSGELVWVFGFVKGSTGLWSPAPYQNKAYPALIITNSGGSKVYTVDYDFGDTDASIVVLRDPMFSATDVEVTY